MVCQSRSRQLRQHLRRLRETLANSEANAISDVISEATAGHLRLDLRKRIAAAELSLSACETEIASVKQEKKRTDWMRHFDTKSLDADGLSDETKKQVLQQMVDRIQVFYDPKAETHRLDIHFFDTVNPHVLKSGDLDSENKTVQVKDGTVLIPVVAKKNVPGRVNRKQTNRSKPLKTK
jgi:hypothetical protein